MMFSDLSNAINHYIYLKVAHSFSHNVKNEPSYGKHFIVSGIFKDQLDSTQFVGGARAGIGHITIPIEEDNQFIKVYLHEFLKELQSGQPSRSSSITQATRLSS